MSRADYLMIAQMAEDGIKADAFIESKAAFTLIKRLAVLAAERGQRRKQPSSTPQLHDGKPE